MLSFYGSTYGPHERLTVSKFEVQFRCPSLSSKRIANCFTKICIGHRTCTQIFPTNLLRSNFHSNRYLPRYLRRNFQNVCKSVHDVTAMDILSLGAGCLSRGSRLIIRSQTTDGHDFANIYSLRSL
jgi:hypothetical protein